MTSRLCDYRASLDGVVGVPFLLSVGDPGQVIVWCETEEDAVELSVAINELLPYWPVAIQVVVKLVREALK